MNTFKEFFKANHDYTVFLEMAYREHVVKRPVSIDNEDIDFLYQVDQKDWSDALNERYKILYETLRQRDQIRNKIKSELLKTIQTEFGTKKQLDVVKKIINEKEFKERFKKIVLDFASKYNDYGKPGEGQFNKIKLSKWLEKDMDDYDLSSSMGEMGYRRSDIKNAYKDFVYYIVDAIVPFVEEKERYKFKGSFIKFYINRLLQKLETTKGSSYLVPESHPYNPSHLENLKKTLPEKAYKKIEPTQSGEYGFDLSNVKTTSKKGKQRIGSKSFSFPSENNIKSTLAHLLTLNFHRHFGPLPSDEDEDQFEDQAKADKFKYKIIRTNRGNMSKDAPHESRAAQKDNYIPEKIRNGIRNNISKILTKAQSGDYQNWNDPKLDALWEIIGNKNKELATSGEWFKEAGLDTNEDLKDIFGDKQIDIDARGNTAPAWSEAGKQQWYRELKTPNGGGVAGNAKLKKYFSEFFATLVSRDRLLSNKQLSPQILSKAELAKFGEDGHYKLDKEDLAQIKNALTPEQFETFKKTGRLPYSLNQDKKNPELLIGNNKAFLVMPTIKEKQPIYDENGEKIGEKTIHLPLINGSKFIKDTPSKIKISDEDEEEGDAEEIEYSRPITTSRSSSEIKDIKDLADMYEKNPEKYKDTEIEAAVKAYKDPNSSGIYTYNGETKNIADGIVFDDSSNKMYATSGYSHGVAGVDGAHFRQEETGEKPDTLVKRENRKKLSGIFGVINKKDLDNLTPTLTRLGYRNKANLFSEQPAEGYQQMVWTSFRLERYGDNSSGDDEESDNSGDAVGSTKLGGRVREIKPVNDGSGELEGYYDVIKGISDCLLSKGARACGTEIGEKTKINIINNVSLIEKAHDFVVELMIQNISKGDSGDKFKKPIGRIKFTNSEIGKILQSDAFGQESRRKRKDLAAGSGGIDQSSHPFRKEEPEDKKQTDRVVLNKGPIEDKFLETIFGYPEKEQAAFDRTNRNIEKEERIKQAKVILAGMLEDPETGVVAKLNQYSSLYQEVAEQETLSDDERKKLLDRINDQENKLYAYLDGLKQGVLEGNKTRKRIVEDYFRQLKRNLNKVPAKSTAVAPKSSTVAAATAEEKPKTIFDKIEKIVSYGILNLPMSKTIRARTANMEQNQAKLEITKSIIEIASSLQSQTADITNINKIIGNNPRAKSIDEIKKKIQKFNYLCSSLEILESTGAKIRYDFIKNNLKIVWKDIIQQYIDKASDADARPSTPEYIRN